MSTFVQRSYPCPACGVVATRSVAVSLNGGRRTDLRDAIFAGQFQRFTCEACAAGYLVEDPMMYIDFDRKEWIACYPPAREREWPSLETEPVADWRQSMVTHAARAAREMSADFRIRAVFGLAALREKLLCFAHGVDDGWLEVLKLDLLRREDGPGFHPDLRPRLLAIGADALWLGNTRARVEVPRERLTDISTSALEWSEAYEALTRGAYVDTGRILLAPG